MKLSELLKLRQRKTVRDNRVKAIEDLGFDLVDERGWHGGRFWPKRYVLVRKDGTRLDNNGDGFPSSHEALYAATSASKQEAATPTPEASAEPAQP